MADTTTKSVLKLVATTSSKIRSLTIQNGQLIFIQDLGRIAFDFNDKRVFYNQIVELETESARMALEEPLDGYYFVVGSGRLWSYNNGWIPMTGEPEAIEFIDVELPQLGQENKLYVNKAERDISVWDDETNQYITVANYTMDVTVEDIQRLFN